MAVRVERAQTKRWEGGRRLGGGEGAPIRGGRRGGDSSRYSTVLGRCFPSSELQLGHGAHTLKPIDIGRQAPTPPPVASNEG